MLGALVVSLVIIALCALAIDSLASALGRWRDLEALRQMRYRTGVVTHVDHDRYCIGVQLCRSDFNPRQNVFGARTALLNGVEVGEEYQFVVMRGGTAIAARKNSYVVTPEDDLQLARKFLAGDL